MEIHHIELSMDSVRCSRPRQLQYGCVACPWLKYKDFLSPRATIYPVKSPIANTAAQIWTFPFSSPGPGTMAQPPSGARLVAETCSQPNWVVLGNELYSEGCSVVRTATRYSMEDLKADPATVVVYRMNHRCGVGRVGRALWNNAICSSGVGGNLKRKRTTEKTGKSGLPPRNAVPGKTFQTFVFSQRGVGGPGGP